jgi:putative transposase
LTYMAERSYDVTVPVDPADSSQLCSGCGCVVRKDLSVRTHHCPVCGLVLDRDVNAARNVLKRGLEIGLVGAEDTPGGEGTNTRLIGDAQVASVNQEAHDLSHG